MKLYFVLPILPMDSLYTQMPYTLTSDFLLHSTAQEAREIRGLSTDSFTLKTRIQNTALQWNANHPSRKGYTIEGNNIILEHTKYPISEIIS